MSVVIPCFNYGRYVGDCLESILGQVDAPPFEIIVVDDGSTDETSEVLARFTDPRLRVVRKENGGHASAINVGLRLARGAILTRIDPDDRYRPLFLATVCDRFRRYPDAALVYGRAAMIDCDGIVLGITSSEPHRGDFYGSEFVRLMARNFICAPTVAARRDAWLAHLPVPADLAFHDWYFTLLIAREHPLCFVDAVLAEYRIHGSNHHTAVSRNGSEERSVLWLLDRLYAQVETDPRRQIEKSRARGRVYASHYLDFADKYFGFQMNDDARRCYLAAFRNRPASVASSGVFRRFAATLVGRRLYERAKQSWKAVGS